MSKASEAQRNRNAWRLGRFAACTAFPLAIDAFEARVPSSKLLEITKRDRSDPTIVTFGKLGIALPEPDMPKRPMGATFRRIYGVIEEIYETKIERNGMAYEADLYHWLRFVAVAENASRAVGRRAAPRQRVPGMIVRSDAFGAEEVAT